MDLSTLERTISVLERSLDSLTSWLLFWTALVVIGLILEYAPEFVGAPTTRRFNWKKLHTLIGGILITAGVAGELVVEFKASRIETKLRASSHKIEALLNREAGDARKSAGDAGERAGQANERAGKADERAGKANVRAGKLEIEAAAQRRRAAEAEAKVAAAQLELKKYVAEVAERQKPRHLTLEQKRSLARSVPSFVGTTVDISCGDAEACGFAKELSSALKDLGVTVTGGDGDVMTVLIPFVGIKILQRNEGAPHPATAALLSALEKFSLQPFFSHELSESVVRLIIGIKP